MRLISTKRQKGLDKAASVIQIAMRRKSVKALEDIGHSASITKDPLDASQNVGPIGEGSPNAMTGTSIFSGDDVIQTIP